MPYTEKAWLDLPSVATPVSATSLKAMEKRVAMSAVTAIEEAGPGVVGYAAYRVAALAGMTLDVGAGGGYQAVVIPIGGTTGEMRRYEGALASPAVTIPAADSTNPRIDAVIAEAPADADSNTPNVRVVAGVATSGATLDNRTGAAALPAASVHLADVLVGAGVTSIVAGNIRDRRRMSTATAGAHIIQALTGDVVPLEPVAGVPVGSATISPTATDNHQAATLVRLHRRVTANRFRWRYVQGATAATSNYFLGLADYSGRIIVATAATAFTGAAASMQSRNETFSSQTFEAGLYWVVFGVAAMTASSSVTYLAAGNASQVVGAPGVQARVTSGGATAPTTILGMTDAYTAAVQALPVPVVSLAAA